MAETQSFRCESVPPAPRSRLSNRTGTIKFQHFVLEALIANRFSGMVKYHLENAVNKQLDELVKIRFMNFMFSVEYTQHLVKIIHAVFAKMTAYRASPDKTNSHVSPPIYQLQFQTQPIPVLYANKKLGELLGSIEVALVDKNGNIVCTGIESSAMLELVVLDADLSEKATTLEEFRKAELKPRDNRPPLLKGKTIVELYNGKGMVDPSLCFTDNSSWLRKKQFCLGLVPVSTELPIRGAKTVAFTVLDHRSEANQKSDIPESTDEVWKLHSVRKTGPYHRKLQQININTVGEFLQCLDSKPEELKKIFGKIRDWKNVISHAKKCNSVHGAYHTEVSHYSNEDVFIREEEPLAQGAINSPNPSVSNPISDLAGSSIRSFVPGRTTCLAAHSEEPSYFSTSGGGQACEQLQNNMNYQDRPSNEDTPVTTIQCFDQAQEFPLIGPVCLDSYISTELSNMDGQGMVMIHAEVENVRGQELEAEGDRIQQAHKEINNLLCRPGGELYTNVPAVTSPSRVLRRRRVSTPDQVFRFTRTRVATHDRSSNEVSSFQESPCHGLSFIGPELPDFNILQEFPYSDINSEIYNKLHNSNLSIVPMESSSGAFGGYRSDQNLVHSSTNLDFILSNMFSGEAHRDNSQVEYLTQHTLGTLDKDLSEGMHLLDTSVAINSYEENSFTTGSSNENTDMSIWGS